MEITNVDTAEFWNREAARFDEEADHGLKDPGVRGAWLDLLSGVLPPPPARVADLGCGTGTLSLLLAQRGYRVDGIDLSERMIERAEAKAASVDPAPRFEVADAAEPPLHPATFDVVLSRHVVWALADPAAAAPLGSPARARRSTRPHRRPLGHGSRSRRGTGRGARRTDR